jgi:S-DNA-T family DNA segregation ATPase FtsK/SpoIIIE
VSGDRIAGIGSAGGAGRTVDHTVAPGSIGSQLPGLLNGVDGPMLVLIDDAEAIDDPGGVLEQLTTSDRPNLLVVAAGRNDGIRTGYSHWTRPMRRARLGVLLRPDVDLDGDILGAPLPRRAPVAMVPGRGYLVSGGEPELIQVALPR